MHMYTAVWRIGMLVAHESLTAFDTTFKELLYQLTLSFKNIMSQSKSCYDYPITKVLNCLLQVDIYVV